MFGGLSRTTVWREIRAGRLPAACAVSPGRKAWALSAIQAWQAQFHQPEKDFNTQCSMEAMGELAGTASPRNRHGVSGQENVASIAEARRNAKAQPQPSPSVRASAR